MPVSAKNANGMLFLPNSAGIAMIERDNRDGDDRVERHPVSIHATEHRPPGIPRSREKAYHVREALVSPAAPQKSWPIVAMIRTNFAAQESSALVKIAPTKPAPSLTASTSLAANRNASRTNQPISAEKKTERQTPCAAADRRALRLLGGVRRGVVAGLRVHREQEADRQHEDPEAEVARGPVVQARVVDALAEDEACALVIVGHEDEQSDDDSTPMTCQPTEMLFISARPRSPKMFTSV